MTVLEQFGALSRFTVPEDSGCGVVTTADAGYFPGLQILCATCVGKVPLAVFDAGLTPRQRAWCEARVQVLDLPQLLMPRTEDFWPAWNKPRLIRSSPFQTTLWLDADSFVVGDLNPLFERARLGPFGLRHSLGWTRFSKEELYTRFPVPLRIPEEEGVNAGILAFGPDEKSKQLLDTWERMVLRAAEDAELRGLIQFHDQSCLHWAIQAVQYLDAIVTKPGWNRVLMLPGRGGPEHFIAQLKIRPEDVVMHAHFRPKYWRAWGDLDVLPPEASP
jgi:hypothetical protein